MRAKNFQLVELIKPASVASAGDRLYFTDQPQLRTLNNRIVQITAISAYSSEAMPKSPSGNDVVGVTDFLNAFLVLNIGSIDKYQYIPMVELNPVVPNVTSTGNYVPAVGEYFQLLTTTQVDWTKSYLQFGAAPTASQLSYVFGVRYLLFPQDVEQKLNPGVI